MNRVFATPVELGHDHLWKVGYSWKDNAILVAPRLADRLDVWKCNVVVPCSWNRVVSLRFQEVLFSAFGLSQDAATVGILAICIQKQETAMEDYHPKVQFWLVDVNSGVSCCYSLDPLSGLAFDRDVFLDNLIVGHSVHAGWHFYDRSVVSGPIPFWTVVFNDNILLTLSEAGTFDIVDRKIPADDSNCQRYAVLLDGGTRQFAKFTDDHGVIVFDQQTDTWLRYTTALTSDLVLNESRVRGVAETIGRRGHRMGAVESPLSVFADDGNYVAKVYEKGIHRFYRLTFDHAVRTVCLTLAAQIRLSHTFDRSFYPLCTPSEVILISSVGEHFLTIVSYAPPSLKQAASWAVQRTVATQNKLGAWSGGIAESRLRQLCGYRGSKLLM